MCNSGALSEVCKTSSFTNDQKAFRDFVTSAQWDVCPDFLCKKVNAVAVTAEKLQVDNAVRICYNIRKTTTASPEASGERRMCCAAGISETG